MRTLANLREHSVSMAAAFDDGEKRRVQPAGANVAPTVKKQVRVTGFVATNGLYAILVKDLDQATGNVTGAEYTAYVYSVSDADGTVGKQPLTAPLNTLGMIPPLQVGSQPEVERRTVCTAPATVGVTGWWTVQTYTPYGCQGS